MTIPTEPIGSIPRPKYLVDGMMDAASGKIDQTVLRDLTDQALSETIMQFGRDALSLLVLQHQYS